MDREVVAFLVLVLVLVLVLISYLPPVMSTY